MCLHTRAHAHAHGREMDERSRGLFGENNRQTWPTSEGREASVWKEQARAQRAWGAPGPVPWEGRQGRCLD